MTTKCRPGPPQIKELRKALAILDEQIELRRQSPLSDDTVR
jgi:hypothetical protein